MMVNKIEFYAYLPKIYFFSYRFKVGAGFFSSAEPDPGEKLLDPHPCFNSSDYNLSPEEHNSDFISRSPLQKPPLSTRPDFL